MANAGVLFYQLATNEEWDFKFEANNKQELFATNLNFEKLKPFDNKRVYSKDLQGAIKEMISSFNEPNYSILNNKVNIAIGKAPHTIKKRYHELKTGLIPNKNVLETDIPKGSLEEYNVITFLDEFIKFINEVKIEDPNTKTYLENTIPFLKMIFTYKDNEYTANNNVYEEKKDAINTKLKVFNLSLDKKILI